MKLSEFVAWGELFKTKKTFWLTDDQGNKKAGMSFLFENETVEIDVTDEAGEEVGGLVSLSEISDVERFLLSALVKGSNKETEVPHV